MSKEYSVLLLCEYGILYLTHCVSKEYSNCLCEYGILYLTLSVSKEYSVLLLCEYGILYLIFV